MINDARERLKYLLNKYTFASQENGDRLPDYQTKELLTPISQALDQAEKNEKVLEILKNKRVNVRALIKVLKIKYGDYKLEVYNMQNDTLDDDLDETEFNLIKEWLCKE